MLSIQHSIISGIYDELRRLRVWVESPSEGICLCLKVDKLDKLQYKEKLRNLFALGGFAFCHVGLKNKKLGNVKVSPN